MYNNYGGEAQGYRVGQQQGYGSGAPSNQYGDDQRYSGRNATTNQQVLALSKARYDQGYRPAGGYQSHQQGYGRPQRPLTDHDEYPLSSTWWLRRRTSYQGGESTHMHQTKHSSYGRLELKGDRGLSCSHGGMLEPMEA